MKKKLYIAFICLFMLACAAPVTAMCVAGPAPSAANEITAAKPKLIKGGELNTEFLSDVSDYVAKGFRPRLWCITLWDSLCAKGFGHSCNDDVIVGRDGWLFYFTAAEDRSGESLLSDGEIWSCARNLCLMEEYVQSRGGNFLFVMPNAKYDLYPQYVREYEKLQDGRNVEKLQTELADMGVDCCDMYALFRAQDEVLYWHTDSHWNGRGAALAADGILSALGREAHWFAGDFVPAEDHLGDLYEMLCPAGKQTEPDWTPAEGFSFAYEGRFLSVNDMEIETSCESGEGVLLMYRDSFGRNLYPYLAEEYASAYFSRENSYDLCRMESLGATDVVVELGQRNVSYLVQYNAVYPAPEREKTVLSGLDTAECDVSVTAADNAPSGCVLVQGELTGRAWNSPVYLAAGNCVYEAMLTETGFAAWLPERVGGQAVEVYIISEE